MRVGTVSPPSTEATVGPWLLQAKIGRGATATVYRAVNVHTGQQAALKMYHAGAMDAHRRESAAAALACHANLVRVLESGHDSHGAYVATELVLGEALSTRLGAPMVAERAIQIAADVAAGLAHLHDCGKVHGDIKPANVLIDLVGQARLSDYGTLQDQGCRVETGSPAYMSPEQALGKCLDARADVYSLGVMLFEMLTGHPPFIARSAVDVMAMQVRQPVPALDPAVPRPLAAIVRRCLEKNPSRRYPNARALADALAALRLDRSWTDRVRRFVRRFGRSPHAA